MGRTQSQAIARLNFSRRAFTSTPPNFILSGLPTMSLLLFGLASLLVHTLSKTTRSYSQLFDYIMSLQEFVNDECSL